MRRNKWIFRIWMGAAVATVLLGGIVLHSNIRRGQAEAKEVAIQTLCRVAEQVVCHEFEKLGINHVYWHDGSGKKSITRKAKSTAGEFEIKVDSLKEAQALYSLEHVGAKADALNCSGEFPVEKMCTEWKAEMDARYGGVYALSLAVHPLGKDTCQESSVGDEGIIASRYVLGTYYLDEMYTMSLTAYMQLAAWHCVDWADGWLLCCLFGLVLLVGWAAYVRFRLYFYNKEEVPKKQGITYPLGKYIFDAVHHTLTYEGETKECRPQASKLLLHFAEAPDRFLTNDDIAIICGWSSGDLNLDKRRRKAISLLNQLFSEDDSVQVVGVSERKGYRLIVRTSIESSQKV